MKKSVSLAVLGIHTLGLAVLPASAEGIHYLGRVGLYDQFGGSEFTRDDNYQLSFSGQRPTESGLLHGNSYRYEGGSAYLGIASWVAKASDGSTTRIGFFSGPEFTRNDNYQESLARESLTESGWISGDSWRYNGGSTSMGKAAWVANALNGATTRLGFFSGSEFTREDGYQTSGASALTDSGWVSGYSNRYDGSADSGQAVWIANAFNGATARLGFFSGTEFTSETGEQQSGISAPTKSGWISGESWRYNGGSESLGYAAWVANALDGTTTRVGFFSGNEFTSERGEQRSSAQLTQSGWISGASWRYNGGSIYVGLAAWVTHASGVSPTRVGFFSTPEFTRNDNFASSFVSEISESGWVAGTSQRYNAGSIRRGVATWVTKASGGPTTRIGLFSGPEFTRSDGHQFSGIHQLTESGWLRGFSARFNGSIATGIAAWVASDGSTIRVGLFSGDEFTSSDGQQVSDVYGLTESGLFHGSSERFVGGSDFIGRAAWTGTAANGSTTRVGLFSSPEFTRNDNYQYSYTSQFTEAGLLTGISDRFNGGSIDLGRAAWLANASNGSTTRLGFFSGSEFTSNENYQRTYAGYIVSGWVSGISKRYLDGATELGEAAWVANVSDGSPIRVGMFGSTAYTSLQGREISSAPTLTESGFAWGFSKRYNGNNTDDGQTAWIYELTTGTQITFGLSVRPTDGYSFSEVSGITSLGLAYGWYTLFSGEINLGDRAFLWSSALGVMTLDETVSGGIAQYGWESVKPSYGNSAGIVSGTGHPLDGAQDSRGVFLFQVPEPTSAAFLILGTMLFSLHRRRPES